MVHTTAEKRYEDLVNEVFLTALGQPMRQAVEQARPEGGWSSLKQLQDRTVEICQSLGRSGKQITEKPMAAGQGKPASAAAIPASQEGQGAGSQKFKGSCNWCDRKGHKEDSCRDKKNGLPSRKRDRSAYELVISKRAKNS